MNPSNVIAFVVGCAAMIEDLARRRISNWTCGGAFLGGLLCHLLQKGWAGAFFALLGTLAGFSVFFIFYLLGGMGGGDVKLMAGFGALLGPGQILRAALLTALIGGAMALTYIAFRAARLKFAAVLRQEVPKNTPAHSIPYAPAIAVGAWLVLISEM